ncbi:hypothetical protein RCL1_008562 [Eukaryota sp. TZLM3-RCL]
MSKTKKSSTPLPEEFFQPISVSSLDRILGLLSHPSALNVTFNLPCILEEIPLLPLPAFSQFFADLFKVISTLNHPSEPSHELFLNAYNFVYSFLADNTTYTDLVLRSSPILIKLNEPTITDYFSRVFSDHFSLFSCAFLKKTENKPPIPRQFTLVCPSFSSSLTPLSSFEHDLVLDDLNAVATAEHEMVIRKYVKDLTSQLKSSISDEINEFVGKTRVEINSIVLDLGIDLELVVKGKSKK